MLDTLQHVFFCGGSVCVLTYGKRCKIFVSILGGWFYMANLSCPETLCVLSMVSMYPYVWQTKVTIPRAIPTRCMVVSSFHTANVQFFAAFIYSQQRGTHNHYVL